MELNRGPEGREGQQGKEGPVGKTGPSISRAVKLAFIIVTSIFFLTLVGFSWIIHDVRANSNARIELVKQNRQRIKDIQESRIASCQTTYNGIREVFRPFFPPVPRTPKQEADLNKFNSTIDKLIKQCKTQTKS